MEGVLERREEERQGQKEEEEVFDEGLQGRRTRLAIHSLPPKSAATTVATNALVVDSSKLSNGAEPFNHQELNHGILGSRIVFHTDGGIASTDGANGEEVDNAISEERIAQSTSLKHGTAEHGNTSLTTESRQRVTELYLERLYEKPGLHDFYCPNCHSCIKKVIVQSREGEAGPEPVDCFRCTFCFSFLIPVGNWIFHKWGGGDMRNQQDILPSPPSETGAVQPPPLDSLNKTAPAGGFVDVFNKTLVAGDPPRGLPHQRSKTSSEGGGLDEGTTEYEEADGSGVAHSKQDSTPLGQDVTKGKRSSAAATEKEKTGEKRTEETIIGIPRSVIGKNNQEMEEDARGSAEAELTEGVPNLSLSPSGTDPESSSENKLEILKSIVYGGLIESITSLTVVASAASADVTILNVVALALANLIGGLFIIVHNLWDLKKEQPRRASNETNEYVDQYQELLGRKKNFALHITVAVLSFLVFGLVPPVVYGFSFAKSENKDFKLAAVAAASLLCITVLATGKAYIRKPPKSYVKTVLYYVVAGFTASGVSYVAADLVKKLVEKFGWLNQGVTVGEPFGEMRFWEPAWASY